MLSRKQSVIESWKWLRKYLIWVGTTFKLTFHYVDMISDNKKSFFENSSILEFIDFNNVLR